MAITVSLHTDGKLTVRTNVHTSNLSDRPVPFVVANLSDGKDGHVSLFLYTVDEVDKLAFEFSNLSRELRETHGWPYVDGKPQHVSNN